MTLLLCKLLLLAIAAAFAYVAASVFWHEWPRIRRFVRRFVLACDDDGEDIPEDPDRARDWDIADQMEVL